MLPIIYKETGGNRVVLQSKIKIVKASVEDAEAMIKYLNKIGGESSNLLFGENEFHLTVDEEKEFLNKINSTDHSSMMLATVDEEIVGIGSILSQQRKRLSHIAEISISVSKEYWNKGIGTQLMKELISFATHATNIEIITLDVNTENQYAIRMYEKLGFVRVGLFEKNIKIDDEYFDTQKMNLYL